MPTYYPRNLFIALFTACLGVTAGAAEEPKSAVDVARAAETAARRVRYEQTERNVEAILWPRRESIRRETGTRSGGTCAKAAKKGNDGGEHPEHAG